MRYKELMKDYHSKGMVSEKKDVGGHMRAGRGDGVSKRERSRHV